MVLKQFRLQFGSFSWAAKEFLLQPFGSFSHGNLLKIKRFSMEFHFHLFFTIWWRICHIPFRKISPLLKQDFHILINRQFTYISLVKFRHEIKFMRFVSPSSSLHYTTIDDIWPEARAFNVKNKCLFVCYTITPTTSTWRLMSNFHNDINNKLHFWGRF